MSHRHTIEQDEGLGGIPLTPFQWSISVSSTVTLFLFVKGTAESPVEQLVAEAQCAAARDTLEKIRTLDEIGTIVIATRSESFAAQARHLGAFVEYDASDEEFHWGRCLAHLVRKYAARVPLYIGGGSGFLMRAEDWRAMLHQVIAEPNTVIANNLYSCDFAAWSPGEALDKIEPPAIDNDLAYRLMQRAGLQGIALPKNAATQLDIDTPTDLMMTALHPAVGQHLRAVLNAASLDLTRLHHLRNVLCNPSMTALLAGRVAASLTLLLERQTRCQWRIFSEERGMRASGRIARGEVRSLLGYYLDAVGAMEFFATLARLADAIILDTRVLFAHRRLNPCAADRFNSDLLRVEEIRDPFVRELTAAARAAPIPVLLGGHSVVAGGMYVLLEHLVAATKPQPPSHLT